MAMLRLFPAAVVVAVLCIALAGTVLAAPLPPSSSRAVSTATRAAPASRLAPLNTLKERRIELADSHEEEICEVALVASPLSGCAEIAAGRDRARVLLAHDSGLASNVRYANPLGFLKEEPLAVCGALLQQYALGDDE
uniref:Uncharacterized protein n=1 Tax=Ananas comosus var. bracteatus TaxID=296719 RepID=A0A6V7NP97_ANACO|nr:unnamed protein product [Ananas comosus var. bracteatus]